MTADKLSQEALRCGFTVGHCWRTDSSGADRRVVNVNKDGSNFTWRFYEPKTYVAALADALKEACEKWCAPAALPNDPSSATAKGNQ